MGQGIYRSVGWGCLDPPCFDWDADSKPPLFDVLATEYETEPRYIMIPLAVDNEFRQKEGHLPPLPAGLPHVHDRTAVIVPRCTYWPGVGKRGIWVSERIVATWELIRIVARERGMELPKGQPIFVSDWD